MQSDINRVKDWASEWLLKLNVEKCCAMSYTANINNTSATKYFIEDCSVYLFICNSPTDHTVMTEITSVKAAGQQGSELR